jgi:glycosyltransferase involved in cell wall biosynthesis
LPLPPTSGDRQRTLLLHRALARFADVHTISLVAEPRDAALASSLRDACSPIEFIPPTPRGRAGLLGAFYGLSPLLIDQITYNMPFGRTGHETDPAVSRRARELVASGAVDVVVCRYSAAAGIVGRSVPPARLAIDVDGLDDEIYRSKMSLPGVGAARRAMYRRHLHRTRRVLDETFRQAQLLWLTNADEASQVRHDRVELLPNIPFDPPEVAPTPISAPTIGFVGSLKHGPNIYGLTKFVTECWSTIRQAVPEAQLLVAGGGSAKASDFHWSTAPGIQFLGFVESVATVYERSAVSLVPLWDGRGTKIKLLESFMFGRTVVTTPHSLRGYEADLHDERELLLANDSPRMAQACIRLLRDDTLRRRLADSGQRIVRSRYTFDRFASVVESGVRSLLST